MLKYIIKRLLAIFVSLFFLATLTFFMMRSIPGGPFTTDRDLPEKVEQAMLEKYDLDGSLLSQYGRYMSNLVKFDLGPSLKYKDMSVNELIGIGFPISAKLGVIAVAFVIAVGIPMGILSALKQGKLPDKLILIASMLGIAVPSFILATMLLYIFSISLKWFPMYGVESWKGYILPAVALSGLSVASVTRLTRSSMLETMSQDYIMVAKAKGVRKWKIFFIHALKNSIIPIVTVLGPTIASLLTGTFVIEKIFAIPGMGKHFVNSITNRDYTVIMGVTLFFAVFLNIMVLIVDILYAVLDPRIKLDS